MYLSCASAARCRAVMANANAISQETCCHWSRKCVNMFYDPFGVDVCVGCVACRGVMCDHMVRVRRFVRKNNPSFCQLQQTRLQNCPLPVRHTSSTLAGQDMASCTEPSARVLTSSVRERCQHPQIHFRQGRGGARNLWRGRWKCTGVVLSRTDTQHSDPRESHCGRVLRCL